MSSRIRLCINNILYCTLDAFHYFDSPLCQCVSNIKLVRYTHTRARRCTQARTHTRRAYILSLALTHTRARTHTHTHAAINIIVRFFKLGNQ